MKAFLEKVGNLFKRGKTLYFPGCTTKAKIPHVAQNYEALLKAAGVEITTLKDTVCCGGFCLDGGYREDFEQLRHKNMELFTEQQITKIVTNDPFCYRVFKEHYSISVEYAAVVLDKIGCHFSKSSTETASYHDACFLAKHKESIIEEPRRLLETSGVRYCEFPCSKAKAQCCGAGGLLPLNNPALAKRIAERLIKTSPVKKIITASPLCYVHLKKTGSDVAELSEVLTL